MTALYESIDHGPVALEDIRKAYHEVADLVDGIKHTLNEMSASDSQYGRLRLMLCGLDRIEDVVFRIAPEIQKRPE